MTKGTQLRDVGLGVLSSKHTTTPSSGVKTKSSIQPATRNMKTRKLLADEQAELRSKWKKAVREMDEAHEGSDTDRMQMARTDWQQFCGLMCGATSKRTGQPCRRKDLFASGRCKFHGGMSTGPKSSTGKKRSARKGERRGVRHWSPIAEAQQLNEPHEAVEKPDFLDANLDPDHRHGIATS